MFLLFVAVLCTTPITSVATDVLVLPLGVTREFSCTSPPEPGHGIVWLVNGTSAASSQLQYIALGEEVQSGDGGVQRNITFTADIRANNTHIRCIISSFEGDSRISLDLNLTLQGHLSPPTVTYEVSSDNHSVTFSWSAPLTLNISDMEPDILHYVVYIIRDDGHNDTVNTTDTHYELQADPCQSHQYHVEIAAVNVVGEGEKYISPEITLEAYAVAVVSDTTVSFRNGIAVIEMTVEVSPTCPEDEVVIYEVELIATHSDDRLLFISSGDVRKHTVTLRSPDIKMNERYEYYVRIEGVSNSQSMGRNLSTFDVQYVDTTIHNQLSGYIDITCHFAEGSNAKGCRITAINLQEYNTSTTCEFLAYREEEHKATVTVILPNEKYTLLVHDYEAGADDNPAFTTTLYLEGSAQASECATVLSDDNLHSSSEINVIAIVTVISGSIAVAVITTLTLSICFCKHKGKKFAPSVAEQNDYCDPKSVQVPPGRSLSSESSTSSESSSGSDSLEQSIGSHSTSPLIPGSTHTHYADIRVTREHTMTRPPPTSATEPVSYATLLHQDTTTHSSQPQGNMNGQLPGPYTTDDNN